MRVFLVEDSDILRQRLTQTISDIPRTQIIGSADNASDAIAQIKASQPQLVILDIHLKQSSGYEVLCEVKAQRPETRVLILTNYSYPQYRAKYLEAGADYFFDKSTEMERALKAVATEARRPTTLSNNKTKRTN
jgi:DNA-binding NarL/FixJ family response regulator